MERDQGNKLMHWCRTVERMDMIESATFFRVWSSAPIFVIVEIFFLIWWLVVANGPRTVLEKVFDIYEIFFW